MSFIIEEAKREQVKLKIAITAPSGGGKTYSSLLLAAGLAGGDMGKVCVLDTENAAHAYAGRSTFGAYKRIQFNKPHSPERYLQALDQMAGSGIEVAILDSITPEWSWCKAYHEKLGGRFQDWGKVTPLHDGFVKGIIDAPIHVICTMRRKSDYAISREGDRTVVTKVGLKQEQRDGMEYEFYVVWALNQAHLATAEKDRTGLFMGRPAFTLGEETGKELLTWANDGDPAVYTASDAQKKQLCAWLAAEGVTDRAQMKEISDELVKENSTFTRELVSKRGNQKVS